MSRTPYRQLYDAAACAVLGKQAFIDQNRKETNQWKNRRDKSWFTEQETRLREWAEIRDELRFIAANATEYDAWKASVSSAR